MAVPIMRGALKYVIHTRVGDGPKYLDDAEENHLLTAKGEEKK